ncbi:hypothetical protein BDN70DRAFT_850450 [Pholiota conissans]|uniref:Protein SMG7 n=1 Tax=Pholiota conissans TaxID=109636 RepID=A0A9P6D534_9AGAR|nr:hypothetical protein BDN70DRAFT_850450 [Pholiota conissans]
MAEPPASVAREAKSIHQSLKELLKTKEPFDKEVDFQRKNLRRRYLNLLLVHPTAPESKDVENHLWMQTSYAFISSYKQRIAALDRTIQNTQRHPQAQQGQQGPSQPRNANHGVVEHRKLVQRFRQFLADEEKFWTQLVLRLRRLFNLTEAQPALVALGLMTEIDDIPASTEALETRDGVMHGASGRNHYQFPPEDPTASQASLPTTPEERESRLAILSKALICLGDIARYRELYNESNGRRPGQEEGATSSRRGRNRRGGGSEAPPRPRNYSKAQQCYEQARMLVPSEGNPSHQLAILSSYKKDSFGSLIHYYRALCVSQPYDTAAENMGTVLSKALETWRQRMKKERDKNTANEPPASLRAKIDAFQEKVVVLHALWRVGTEKGVEKMKAVAPKHNEKVAHEFYELVAERHLPIDMISNIIILSQGALWKHRMIRDTSASRNNHHVPPPPGTSILIEWGLLSHIMDLHLDLLEVGKDELKDPPTMDDIDDLAQRISATFRRTLPALRIASKWLRANYKYVLQDHEFAAFQTSESAKGVELQKKALDKISGYSVKTIQFWKTYAQFILALSQAFPAAKLPAFDRPLEEDIEMRGFLPLRKLMGEIKKGENGDKSLNGNQQREQVHPNVEQLMRIADLLDDAKTLTQMENSPLLLINNHVIFNPESVEDVRPPTHPELNQPKEDAIVTIGEQNLLDTIRDNSLDSHPRRDLDVDAMSEATNHTADEVLREAFDFLNASEGESEDEIVWNPSASPVVRSPISPPTPLTPVKAIASPKALSPRSPTYYPAKPTAAFNIPSAPLPTPVTTAQNLLQHILSPSGQTNRGLSSNTHNLSHADPLSQHGPIQRPSQSIWSASIDEQPLMYSGNGAGATTVHSTGHGGQVYPTSPRQYGPALLPSQDLSQPSIWASSYASQSQNSQQNYVGALPSAPFAQPPQMMMTSPGGVPNQRHQTHQRIPSSSLSGQTFLSQSHVQHDPFAYTSPTQLPIQRPQHNMAASTTGYMNMTASPLSLSALGSHVNAGAPNQYYTSPPATFHARQASMHDPRAAAQQNYLSPPMSQVWSNIG